MQEELSRFRLVAGAVGGTGHRSLRSLGDSKVTNCTYWDNETKLQTLFKRRSSVLGVVNNMVYTTTFVTCSYLQSFLGFTLYLIPINGMSSQSLQNLKELLFSNCFTVSRTPSHGRTPIDANYKSNYRKTSSVWRIVVFDSGLITPSLPQISHSGQYLKLIFLTYFST